MSGKTLRFRFLLSRREVLDAVAGNTEGPDRARQHFTQTGQRHEAVKPGTARPGGANTTLAAPCSSLLVVHDSDDNTHVPPYKPREDNLNATTHAVRRRCANSRRCTAGLVKIHAAYIWRRSAVARRPRRRRGQRTRRRATSAARRDTTNTGDARAERARHNARSARGRVPADQARRDPDWCEPRDSQADIDAHSCAPDAPPATTAVFSPSRTAAVVARHGQGPAFYVNLDRGDGSRATRGW